MLDHNDAVTALAQTAEGAVEEVDVGEGEAGGGFVEEGEGPSFDFSSRNWRACGVGFRCPRSSSSTGRSAGAEADVAQDGELRWRSLSKQRPPLEWEMRRTERSG
ncbi:MAG: hypothetical protein AAGC60_14170 [Acidobacteriota bacterium]